MKAADGRIAIHSPIPLMDADMEDIERWGEPAFCIVPDRRHRLDSPAFRHRYHALKIVCPDASLARAERVVAVDGGYEMLPPEFQWRMLAMTGGEAAFVSRNDERVTLIFGDALINLPHLGGALGVILRLIGPTGGRRVTPANKAIAVSDRQIQSASQFRKLAATPCLMRLVPGHGANLEGDAAAILRMVADRI